MVSENVEFASKNALADELADFIRAVNATISEGKVVPTRVSADDGVAALKLAVALEEASRRNNEKYGFKVSGR